jgi:hypothetical protein
VRGLYVYRRITNAFASINVLRPYDAFNIPLSRRDPGADGAFGTADDGGQVTIYDFDPAFIGSRFVGNRNTNRPDGRDDSYQSFELALNRRLANGWAAGAGYTATKFNRWIVPIAQNPNEEFFPLDDQWRWSAKFNATYTAPYDILLGAIVDVVSPFLGQRTYVFRAVDPDGGPRLRQQNQITIPLEPFGQRREGVQPSLNLRAGKQFKLGGARVVDLNVDILNALNANAVKAANYVSGPTFGRVTDIMPPRQIRFGLNVRF